MATRFDSSRSCSFVDSARRLAAACVFALAATAAAPDARAAAPDLAVLSLNGPQTAHVGLLNYVTLDVWNVHSLYAGAYQAEVLLSTDAAYDASDVVVDTVTSSSFSTQVAFFTIPASLPGGQYRWIARVLPVAGETNLANNVYVGLPVNILATDLSLVDDSPIVFQSAFQTPVHVDAEIEVANIGNADSILLFATEVTTAASWLSIDIGDGFAIEGKEPSKVVLRCDSTGLPIGIYVTTVRFHNSNNHTDFQDVEVRLEVGFQGIVLGDRVRGQIGEIGETDEVHFDALAGTKLILKGHVLAGNLKFIVTLFDPNGQVEHVLNYKNTHVKVQKVVTLASTGKYRMVFSGKGATTGSFRIKTSRTLPALAQARTETATAATATFPVLMYAGAKFDVSVLPGATFAGPASVSITDPDGAILDLSSLLITNLDGTLKVESFVAQTPGEYHVAVSGFGPTPGADADLLLYPIQPKKGNAKVYVP